MTSAYQCFHCGTAIADGDSHNCIREPSPARLRWHRYRIGDLLLADERGADRMPTANANYIRSVPAGHTITSSTISAEQVYMLWRGKQHVATMRVPVDDDGARRAAVRELQRRAEEC